jgi:hypothetical protein
MSPPPSVLHALTVRARRQAAKTKMKASRDDIT